MDGKVTLSDLESGRATVEILEKINALMDMQSSVDYYLEQRSK